MLVKYIFMFLKYINENKMHENLSGVILFGCERWTYKKTKIILKLLKYGFGGG